MGRFLKNLKAQGVTGSAKSVQIPKGTSAQRPTAPTIGDVRFNTDTGSLETFNGTTFKTSTVVGNVTPVVDAFAGDGSTVEFTMSQSASEVKQIMVFIGGVHQDPTTAYTVSGTTLTFTSAVPNSEAVSVVHDLYSTNVTS